MLTPASAKQDKAQQWFERIQKELPGTPYANSAATWLETKTLDAAPGRLPELSHRRRGRSKIKEPNHESAFLVAKAF